jgi:GNAT superfamily N-acetyltransferase
MLTTRYAISSDLDRLYELALTGVHEIQFMDRIDEGVFKRYVGIYINDPNYFVRVAVDKHDVAIGGIIARISPTWFSDQWVLEGFVIFVDKDYRGKGLALKLYKEHLKWGQSFDCVATCRLQTSAGIEKDFSNMFKKLGYTQVGGVFTKLAERQEAFICL